MSVWSAETTQRDWVMVPFAIYRYRGALGLTFAHIGLITVIQHHWRAAERLPRLRVETIAEEMGVKYETARTYLRQLRDLGYLEIQRTGRASVYDLSGLVARIGELIAGAETSDPSATPDFEPYDPDAEPDEDPHFERITGMTREEFADRLGIGSQTPPKVTVVTPPILPVPHKEKEEKKKGNTPAPRISEPEPLPALPFSAPEEDEKRDRYKGGTRNAADILASVAARVDRANDAIAANGVHQTRDDQRKAAKRMRKFLEKRPEDYNTNDIEVLFGEVWRKRFRLTRPPGFTMKDRKHVKVLIDTFGAAQVAKVVLTTVGKWTEVSGKLRVSGTPSVALIFGYRASLFPLVLEPEKAVVKTVGAQFTGEKDGPGGFVEEF